MPPCLNGTNSCVIGQLDSALISTIREAEMRVEVAIPAVW